MAPTLPVPAQTLTAKGYPTNWPEIAATVKTWAGWQCEHCAHPHDFAAGRCLTVHHLNGDKTNCAFENLLACCQRCHLHLQARYVPGQTWLFGAPGWVTVRQPR